MHKRIAALFLTILLVFFAAPVHAQTSTPPSRPVYIVQEGDTLWEIAARFNVDVDDLRAANGLVTNDIYVDDRLIIPNLDGYTGILVTEVVPYGETLLSLVRQHRADEALLRKLNHIVSPTELYAGYSLVLLEQEDKPAWTARANLEQGETLLELAVRQNTDPWTIASINDLSGTWAGLPGDVLYLPSGSSTTGATGLPPIFASAEVTPLPIMQGTAAQIRVTTGGSVTSLGGVLADYPLHFFLMDDGSWVALQGVHALTEPGPYPLRIEAKLPDGSVQSFEQMVLVTSGYYPTDPVLVVNPSTIDPKVTQPEDAFILSVVSPSTPTRYWDGVFQSPAYDPNCFTSRFGNRRNYETADKSLTLSSFHAGLDFCGGVGLPIKAPAPGIVVFAGPLDVRGNATIIDHGWGVYSGIWHQSEIQVQVGQQVQTGDVIGLVGGTGRVTGAHLHWELWVDGVQVNPLDWLSESFPR